MKNLQIIIGKASLTSQYIELINKIFNIEDNKFYLLGKSEIKDFENIVKLESRKTISNFFKLIKDMNGSKKIILHGLFHVEIVALLFCQPWLLKKVNWVIWGGDLYYHQEPKLTFKSKLNEFMRCFCIKRFGGFITQVRGDYELAQKWYGVKGKYYNCFMYPSNLYKDYNILNKEKNEQKIYIQVGNSADTSNNHIEILEKLKKFKNENIEIICPLSYGDEQNVQKVKEYGDKIFGKKFNALTEFLEFSKYLEILGKVDIAIFNHKRQQAMGNITTLLGLGKKVYIRSDITSWKLFKELDIKIWDSMKNLSLEKIFLDEAEKNNKQIKERFSEEKLKEELKNIFDN